jgi:ABC-type bacteriocin/lantibiotic exporter with double-glycine peptidase domain
MTHFSSSFELDFPIQGASKWQHCICFFGKPMDCQKYQETLRVFCLMVDLCQIESGDQTEIRERGINLSGGQKQ